jgi:dihydrofolate reductase
MADDEELEEYFVTKLRRAGTHIMGRNTYENMAQHWPKSTELVAPVMNDIPKVVFSKTLQSAEWPDSRIASGDTAEEIARLKQEPGGEIVAHGGVRFVQSLARLGLVDEYRLYVYPIAVGRGTSLFADPQHPQALRLVTCTAFLSGVVELVYQRAGPGGGPGPAREETLPGETPLVPDLLQPTGQRGRDQRPREAPADGDRH